MYGYRSNETEFYKMNEVAKIINIKGFGKNNIFRLLRNKGILDKNNNPHEKFESLGYFKPIINQVNPHKNCTFHSVSCMASNSGIEFIKTLIA